MALGVNRNLKRTPGPEVVCPVQIPNQWVDAIDAGGVDAADATPIVNPDTQIVASDHHILNVGLAGTTLRLRVAYDRAATAITVQPIAQVFGRTPGGQWEKLVNKNGANQITLTATIATDVDDGTALKYTDVDLNAHAVDLDGCEEVLVGMHTALAHTTGSAANAKLQCKII